MKWRCYKGSMNNSSSNDQSSSACPAIRTPLFLSVERPWVRWTLSRTLLMQILSDNYKVSLKSLKKRPCIKRRSSRLVSLIYSVRILGCNGESLSQSLNRILTYSLTYFARNSKSTNKFIRKSCTISALNYTRLATKLKMRSLVSSMIDCGSETQAQLTCTHLNLRCMIIYRANLNS